MIDLVELALRQLIDSGGLRSISLGLRHRKIYSVFRTVFLMCLSCCLLLVSGSCCLFLMMKMFCC